jgi:2,4-didehydro-3-deoxy-L-rhamnonate hydrolase
MRIANLSGRLVIVTDGGAVDVEKISDGRFPADPQAIYSQWAEFIGADGFDPADLGAPAPAPRQLFAIGLNYRAHALEAGFAIPEDPPVFGGASGAGDRVRYPHRVRRHPAGGRSGARLLGLAR